MAEVKAGSVVVLKSGGPKMTVRWVEEEHAYCEWFPTEKPTGKNEGAKFPVTSLKLLEA